MKPLITALVAQPKNVGVVGGSADGGSIAIRGILRPGG
jgi:hypothetical protein